MAERFNVNQNRLEKLRELGLSKMTPKQAREYKRLQTAYSGFADNMTLQQKLKMISYIEELKAVNNATSLDEIRYHILLESTLDV